MLTRGEAAFCAIPPSLRACASRIDCAIAILCACPEVDRVIFEDLLRAREICVRTVPPVPDRDPRFWMAVHEAFPIGVVVRHGR